MKKFLILSVLFLALFLGGCTSFYSQDQVSKLIQQESANRQAEIDALKQQTSDLQSKVNELAQKAITPAVQSVPAVVSGQASVPAVKSNDTSAKGKYVTYLISKESTLKYCNGGEDDSDAYRKTITTEVESSILAANVAAGAISQISLIKQLLSLSTQCGIDISSLDIKVENGIVKIPYIDGWAGISIRMCSCIPQVEVNLLRLPGITRVVWGTYANK